MKRKGMINVRKVSDEGVSLDSSARCQASVTALHAPDISKMSLEKSSLITGGRMRAKTRATPSSSSAAWCRQLQTRQRYPERAENHSGWCIFRCFFWAGTTRMLPNLSEQILSVPAAFSFLFSCLAPANTRLQHRLRKLPQNVILQTPEP